LGDNLYAGVLHKVDSSQTLHENQLSVRHKLSQQKSDIYVYYMYVRLLLGNNQGFTQAKLMWSRPIYAKSGRWRVRL